MSNNALLKARQHFANFRSPEKLIDIKVPEWELTVWYWPHLSVGERRAINLAGQGGLLVGETDGSKMLIDRHGRQVMELIQRARDEHGQPLFNETQFKDLLAVDPGVIERVTGEMRDEFSEPIENVEKN